LIGRLKLVLDDDLAPRVLFLRKDVHVEPADTGFGLCDLDSDANLVAQ
jgi:hypothetical protein